MGSRIDFLITLTHVMYPDVWLKFGIQEELLPEAHTVNEAIPNYVGAPLHKS